MLKKATAIVLLSVGSAAPMPSPRSSVLLQVAADGDPFTFAMALADAAVPSGIVISESLHQRPGSTRAAQPDRQTSVSTEQLARTFNEGHHLYGATVMDGVLVIAPRGELLSDLRRTCGIGAMEVTGIMSAVRGVFSRLDPALKVSGATLGSFVNSDPVERGDKLRLMFDGTEVRIVDCLNAIARQANVAWIVVTSDDKPEPKLVKAGVIRARGTSTFVDIHTPNPK